MHEMNLLVVISGCSVGKVMLKELQNPGVGNFLLTPAIIYRLTIRGAYKILTSPNSSTFCLRNWVCNN